MFISMLLLLQLGVSYGHKYHLLVPASAVASHQISNSASPDEITVDPVAGANFGEFGGFWGNVKNWFENVGTWFKKDQHWAYVTAYGTSGTVIIGGIGMGIHARSRAKTRTDQSNQEGDSFNDPKFESFFFDESTTRPAPLPEAEWQSVPLHSEAGDGPAASDEAASLLEKKSGIQVAKELSWSTSEIAEATGGVFVGVLGLVGTTGTVLKQLGIIHFHHLNNAGLVKDPSFGSAILFKNPSVNNLYFDAGHSTCQTGVASGFDILAGKNNKEAGDITEHALSIGAVLHAQKSKAINCTLAYQTNEQIGGKTYHRHLRARIVQNIAAGNIGQLQVTIIPEGGINGKSLYIQPPKALSTLQKAESTVKSLANPLPIKGKGQPVDNSTDQSSPGVAIIGLSTDSQNHPMQQLHQ